MAYQRTTWASGDTITSAKLNNIESGILGVESVAVGYEDTMVDLLKNGALTKTTWVQGGVATATGANTSSSSGYVRTPYIRVYGSKFSHVYPAGATEVRVACYDATQTWISPMIRLTSSSATTATLRDGTEYVRICIVESDVTPESADVVGYTFSLGTLLTDISATQTAMNAVTNLTLSNDGVTNIPANADLNNYTTVGIYKINLTQDVSSLTNCPDVGSNFRLVVGYAVNTNSIVQTIYGRSTNKVFTRTGTGTANEGTITDITWTPWESLAYDDVRITDPSQLNWVVGKQIRSVAPYDLTSIAKYVSMAEPIFVKKGSTIDLVANSGCKFNVGIYTGTPKYVSIRDTKYTFESDCFMRIGIRVSPDDVPQFDDSITQNFVIDLRCGTLNNELVDIKKQVQDQAQQISAIARVAELSRTSFEELKQIAQSGQASKYLRIGDQIMTTWSPDGETTYDMPWDVVSFGNAITGNGYIRPGIWLQSHYALPGMQFDASEAIYVPTSDMAPGTYYMTCGYTWGQFINGDSYSITTTQTVPAGGQIVFARTGSNMYYWAGYANSLSAWRCYTFASNSSLTPLETLTITQAATGTNLGTFTVSTKYGASGFNNLRRAAGGYNRWSQSATRQWLNSGAIAGSWWVPQNPFDRAPRELTSQRGFTAGLPEDFLNIVSTVRATTALNTSSDSEIGTKEDASDKFFLASAIQEFITISATLDGVEGQGWEYWADRLGVTAPASNNVNRVRYLISNHDTPANVRLRTPAVAEAFQNVYVEAGTAPDLTGAIKNCNAGAATFEIVPCCVIC